jgi:hypothetical protein
MTGSLPIASRPEGEPDHDSEQEYESDSDSDSEQEQEQEQEEYELERDTHPTYSEIVAERIVDSIRQRILEEKEADASGQMDPWDEALEGVGWIDNEVGIAVELLLLLFPERIGQIDSLFDDCETVEECQEALSVALNPKELQFVDFVVVLGASSYRAFSLLRELEPEAIRNWCHRKGFEF